MIAGRTGRTVRRGALVLALLLAAGPAGSAALTDLAAAPPGAASCSGCHAPAAVASPVPVIHGRPAAEIVAALAAFRAGERPATVMNRIATGFTDAESRVIAEWLSRQQ